MRSGSRTIPLGPELLLLPAQGAYTIKVHMMNVVGAKPSIDEVLRYAEKQVQKFIRDRGAHLPLEHKEEVMQEALIRCANAYPTLDIERGWKAFVQTHCRGSLLDYMRDGTGFKETRWDDRPEEPEPEPPADQDESPVSEKGSETEPSDLPTPSAPRFRQQRLHQRLTIVNSEDNHALDVEEVAGIWGVHSQQDDQNLFRPRWELLARMASVDPDLHLVAKILRGFTQTELAPGFGVTREMLSQRIRSFFKKLDSPEFYNNGWVLQAIYAFGLSDRYHMDAVDNGIGWDLQPVDLDSSKSLELMALFQQQELFT